MSSTPLSQFDGILLDGLEFCTKTYQLFESIRSEENGSSKLRMRESIVEKRLIEELLPICKYIQTHYRLGRYISVRWANGSQTFDAEIVQNGSYVNKNYYPSNAYLEVTSAVHPNEYLSRELLDKKGVAFGLDGISRLKNGEIKSIPTIHSNCDFIQKFSEILLAQIVKKSNKSYPENTTLIICCTLNTGYYENEWDSLMSMVKTSLPQSAFNEIYLYDSVRNFSKSLYPSNQAAI